jgi:hypothetical protein
VTVMFRGKPACECLAAWLPAYEAELLARGILPPGGTLTIYQLIGAAAASGGTHTTGGAFDLIDLPGESEVRVARKMGADATWLRPYNWDRKGGMAHVHGVLTGCPHNGPARYQIDAVLDGYNGLGTGGRGGKDNGPRPLFMRSWSEGIKWHKAQNRRRKIGTIIKSLNARIRVLEAERESLPKP